MNHYEVLGVPMGADPAEIQRAYRRLARRHHPDFHAAADAATQDRNRRRMQEVNEAWSVLGDSARRRRYDDQVRAGTAGTGEAMPVGSHGPVTPPGKGWTPRPDDDAWMSDFEAWRSETDRLPPEPVPTRSSTTQGVVAVLPLGLFVAAVVLGSVALALSARPLLAAAFVCLAASALLFFLVPLREMIRHRTHD